MNNILLFYALELNVPNEFHYMNSMQDIYDVIDIFALKRAFNE